jgi:TolA-binding protein
MFRSLTMDRMIALLMGALMLAMVASACGGKKTRVPDLLVPDMDTAAEQFEVAERARQSAKSVFDPATRRTETRKAIVAYESVLKRFPNDTRHTPAAALFIGDLRREVGEPARAAAQYETVLRNYATDPTIRLEALYGLGLALDELGRPREAKVQYKMLIDQFGDSADPSIRQRVEEARQKYVQIREL